MKDINIIKKSIKKYIYSMIFRSILFFSPYSNDGICADFIENLLIIIVIVVIIVLCKEKHP